jgi:predicted secreted hydrolase
MREYTNTSFWEGAIRVRGTWRGAAVNGKSYVELIGYAGDFVC